ncbi:MAG: Holliday junction resolvase [Candidatus Thermoplasmatota archaeon]|nr:Holliday junction resolvase [Candidatus Thermoplasmatota archaeon]
MSSAYERELKNILEGEKKTLSKVTTSLSAVARDHYYRIIDRPFIVVRAAGSFGVDLVAIRGDISFLVEIKTSITDTLHFSTMNGKLQQQAEKMQNNCEKTKTLPIYAYRLKNHRGDSWRIFTLEIEGLEGRARILHNRLPKLDQSTKGNFIMHWDQGLELAHFIDYLCR